MSVEIYDSVTLSRAVNDLGNAQRNARIMRLFKDGATVHLSKELAYGHDVDDPRILQVRKLHEGSSPVADSVGDEKRLKFPKYRPATEMDEEDASVLDPAAAAYIGAGTDLNSNLAARLVKQAAKLKRRIETSHMVNCFNALEDGSVTFKYEDGTVGTIEFGYGSAGTAVDSIILTTLGGTDVWDNAASDPLTNLDEMAENIRATSEYGGGLDVIMGTTAWKEFRNHASITSLYDNRRMDAGAVQLRENSEYKGEIGGFGIYVVANQYKLDTTWTKAWDPKKIAMVPAEDIDWFSTEYGAPWEIPEGATSPLFLPTKYFSKTLVEGDPVSQKLIVEARPVPVIKNTRCLRVRQVLA